MPALLDACTLDNVLLNNTAATKVFVNARAPSLVINHILEREPVLGESIAHPTL